MKLLQEGGYYTAVVGKQHFWKSEIEKGYDYMDIVDNHFPPAVIDDKVRKSDFGLPANLTVTDQVPSISGFCGKTDSKKEKSCSKKLMMGVFTGGRKMKSIMWTRISEIKVWNG